jgi:hypothetical protein
MWKIFINFILMFFFGYENDEELQTEETIDNLKNDQHFLSNKKKIIGIILILIFLFGWGYYFNFTIPNPFSSQSLEMDLWMQLKNYTDTETFNKISEHIQHIYENPYYRQKELNGLRFIQWTNLLKKTENSEELKESIEILINQIEQEFQNDPKYTSYK